MQQNAGGSGRLLPGGLQARSVLRAVGNAVGDENGVDQLSLLSAGPLQVVETVDHALGQIGHPSVIPQIRQGVQQLVGVLGLLLDHCQALPEGQNGKPGPRRGGLGQRRGKAPHLLRQASHGGGNVDHQIVGHRIPGLCNRLNAPGGGNGELPIVELCRQPLLHRGVDKEGLSLDKGLGDGGGLLRRGRRGGSQKQRDCQQGAQSAAKAFHGIHLLCAIRQIRPGASGCRFEGAGGAESVPAAAPPTPGVRRP